jgi:hypothetical protein
MADVSAIQTSADAKVTDLTLMALAAKVERPVNFFRMLGVELHGQLKTGSGDLQWASVASEQAGLMLARAPEPVVPSQQALLFYFYSPNPVALRQQLISAGVLVSSSPIPTPCPKAKSASRIQTATLC